MDHMTRDQIDELWRQIDHLWKYLGYSEEAIAAGRAADEAKENVDKFKKEIRDQLSTQYDASSKYQTVISTVGFAGYFGIWTLSKDILSKNQTSIVAILGIVSLTTFVCWEIYGMVIRSRGALTLVDLVQKQYTPDEFFRQIEKIKENDADIKSRIIWKWVAVSFISFLSAITGGAILIYAFVRNLV